MALMVYAKTLILNGLGGPSPNYSTALTTTLFTDTAAATIGVNQARRDAARVKIGFVGATTLSQTFPGTISGKLAVVNQLVQVPDEQLDNMLVYLDQYIATLIL